MQGGVLEPAVSAAMDFKAMLEAALRGPSLPCKCCHFCRQFGVSRVCKSLKGLLYFCWKGGKNSVMMFGLQVNSRQTIWKRESGTCVEGMRRIELSSKLINTDRMEQMRIGCYQIRKLHMVNTVTWTIPRLRQHMLKGATLPGINRSLFFHLFSSFQCIL